MNANELFRRHIFGAPVRLFSPTQVEGLENIPNGPCVFAIGPHKSYLDSVIVPSWLQDYELHFLAKGTLWNIPVVGQFLSATGQIPVDRSSVRAADAIIPAVEDLNRGFRIMVFPEGTRYLSDTAVHKGKTGAARIATRAGVPLVPVGLIGFQRSSRHIKRKIVIGAPIEPSLLLTAAETLLEKAQQETILMRRMTTRVMNDIAELSVQRYVP